MKILLLGKNGQIGWELRRTLAPLGEIIALGRQELDLTQPAAIRSMVRAIKPDLIVNAAAYTAVDKAEEEADLAMTVNGIAPGILAEEAVVCGARLIHYSTDYVFDGIKKTPYTEQDAPNPISTYGKTKLAGEEAITATDCDYLILRTSWVYSLRGHNFLLTILRLAAERDELRIVSDQHGAPTWARLIAEATAQVIALGRTCRKLQGLYHLAASGQTTWHGFTEAILKLAQTAKGTPPVLKAITTAEYPASAARPRNSILDSSLLYNVSGIKLPDWKKSLDLTLERQT